MTHNQEIISRFVPRTFIEWLSAMEPLQAPENKWEALTRETFYKLILWPPKNQLNEWKRHLRALWEEGRMDKIFHITGIIFPDRISMLPPDFLKKNFNFNHY